MTQPSQIASLTTFSIAQRFTLGVNRYDLITIDADGTERTLAFAQQKRMKLREEVVFSSDETRSDRLFSFKARQIADITSTVDVLDANGEPIGWFKKDFAQSLLRSTWHLECGAATCTGQERSVPLAVARRLFDTVPLPVHFDLRDASGAVVLSSDRNFGVRDRYRVSVPGGTIDGRVAAAMTVALDTLQNR